MMMMIVLMHTISEYLSVQETKDDSMLAVSRLPSRGPWSTLVSLALSRCPVTKLRVITADTKAADWPYWMRMTVLESK